MIIKTPVDSDRILRNPPFSRSVLFQPAGIQARTLNINQEIKDGLMKIDSYDVSLSSARSYIQKDQETEELRVWGRRDNAPTGIDNSGNNEHGKGAGRDRVNISDEARAEYAHGRHRHRQAAEQTTEADSTSNDDEQGLDSRTLTLKRLVEALTGKVIKLSHISTQPAADAVSTPQSTESPQASDANQAPAEQQWGMSYTYSKTHYESEQTSFSATGTVNTADGKSISFTLGLNMSREYFTQENFSLTAGAPKIDPLVINFSGTAAQLENTSFEFDINSDGTVDQLHQLSPGNGFLVYDKNKDGVVNDGSELFGPTTGNGFSELAAYDEDKNNWIDENDSIFTKLGVWQKTGETDQLQSLKSAGVGAIFLGNAGTQFDLNTTTNDSLGQIRNTGVYLKESGGAGVVQQVDFTA